MGRPVVKLAVDEANNLFNSGSGDYNSLGGAIFSLSDVVISNTTFHNNAARHGGAIYSSSVVITDSIFTDNKATESSDNFPNTGNRGAIYTLHNVRTVNSSFSGNTATGGTGGAVYTEANHTVVSFYGSSFSTNRAISCGALSVNSLRFYTNDVTMVNSTFSINEASGTTDGGGVACFGNAIVNTFNCVFSNNHIAAASNGGVFNLGNSSIVINESSLLRNMAQGSGGVMYTNEYQTKLIIIILLDTQSFKVIQQVMEELCTSKVIVITLLSSMLEFILIIMLLAWEVSSVYEEGLLQLLLSIHSVETLLPFQH